MNLVTGVQTCALPIFTSVSEDGTAIALTTAPNYTFVWTDDLGNTITPVDANTGEDNRIEDLAGGTYTVVATNATTGCVTASVDITIEDTQVNPVVQVTAQTDDTFCTGNTTGDGTLTIEVTENGSTVSAATLSTDYVVTWYRGSVAAANEIFPNDGGTRGSADLVTAGDLTALEDLSTDDYIVVITKDGSISPNAGCEVSSTFNVGSDQPVLTIDQSLDLLSGDNDNCVNPDGFIEVTHVREDGVQIAVTTTNYTFEWRDEANNLITSAVSGTTSVGTENRIEDIDGQSYTVVATNTTTDCVSEAITITIQDLQENPVINASVLVDDSYCDNTGNAGDGQLTIEVFENGSTTASDPTDFTITWYRGATTTNTLAANLGTATIGGTNNTELTGLSAGDYTVVVTKDASTSPNAGCETTTTYTIGSDQPVLTLTANVDYTASDNENCAGNENGAIEITSVSEDGTAVALTTAPNYTFVWTDELGNTVTPVDANTGEDNRIEDLAGGTYTVVATNATTGCVTASVDRSEEHTSELQSPDHLVCRLLLEKKKKKHIKISIIILTSGQELVYDTAQSSMQL